MLDGNVAVFLVVFMKPDEAQRRIFFCEMEDYGSCQSKSKPKAIYAENVYFPSFFLLKMPMLKTIIFTR